MCVSVDVEKRAQLYKLTAQQLRHAKEGTNSTIGMRLLFTDRTYSLSLSPLLDGFHLIFIKQSAYIWCHIKCILSVGFKSTIRTSNRTLVIIVQLINP